MKKATWGGGAVVVGLIVVLMIGRANTQALDAALTEASTHIAESAIHDISVEVSGGDIALSGTVDSEQERERIVTALQSLENAGEIDESALLTLPTASPYSFAVTRKAGRMVMQGNIPTEDMRTALAEAGIEGGDGLTLASGAPERWETVAGTAVAALSQMEEGSLALEDTKLRITGLVQTAEDRDTLLAALKVPEDYSMTAEIETVEPDVSFDLQLAYNANSGIWLSGVAPDGFDRAAVKTALAVSSFDVDVEISGDGDAHALQTLLASIKPVLPQVEILSLTLRADTRRASGAVLPGTDSALVETHLQTALGADARIELAALQPLPSEGTTRVNAATGQREKFSGGFWMPDRPFTPSLDACTTRTREMLARAPVTFVAGGSQLDAQGARTISALVELVRRCVREAGLIAQIGGHTDNRGGNNYQLSAERADVVRQALISQGINPEALSAVGFGASKPIADNGTEAGRAANRRITIAFGYQG